MATATMSLERVADELGKVKAEIAALEEREAELRGLLAESGEAEVDGRLFHVTISRSEVVRVAYNKVVDALDPTPALKKLIRKYTTLTPQTSVRVYSR